MLSLVALECANILPARLGNGTKLCFLTFFDNIIKQFSNIVQIRQSVGWVIDNRSVGSSTIGGLGSRLVVWVIDNPSGSRVGLASGEFLSPKINPTLIC